MQILDDFIKDIEVIDKQTFKNLTLCFLRNRKRRDLQIKNFGVAVREGSMFVEEIGEEGTVPELKFTNRGAIPVFIAEGTIIEGLKQNRTVRVSIVVNNNQQIIVPVHCVEQGRWNAHSRTGLKSKYFIYASLRAKNLEQSHASLKENRTFNSTGSQTKVWRDIEEKRRRLHARSKSGYAGDIFECKEDSINQYMQAFKCPLTSTGLLAKLDGHILGMDIFANEILFQGNLQSLLSGIVSEAIDVESCKEWQKEKIVTVQQFLNRITEAKKEEYKSSGHGKDVRFDDNQVVGSALVIDEGIVHLEAFREAVAA